MFRLMTSAAIATVGDGVALTSAEPAGVAFAEYYPGDLGQAIVAVATFGILLLVLRKWAWRPIIAQLRRREEDIAGALDRAQRREKEADEILRHYQARLAQAEKEAEALISESRAQAEQLRGETLKAAREKAREGADQALRDLEKAKQRAFYELRQATAEMASDIAQSVLRKDLSEADQQRLLDRSLSEIAKKAAEE